MRVLDRRGSGRTSWLLSGINWVTTECAKTTTKKCVANMCLGYGPGVVVGSVNSAIISSISGGVVFAVAAGNDNSDACTSTPSSVGEALVVGATNNADTRASWSNFGACE